MGKIVLLALVLLGSEAVPQGGGSRDQGQRHGRNVEPQDGDGGDDLRLEGAGYDVLHGASFACASRTPSIRWIREIASHNVREVSAHVSEEEG